MHHTPPSPDQMGRYWCFSSIIRRIRIKTTRYISKVYEIIYYPPPPPHTHTHIHSFAGRIFAVCIQVSVFGCLSAKYFKKCLNNQLHFDANLSRELGIEPFSLEKNNVGGWVGQVRNVGTMIRDGGNFSSAYNR